MNRPALALLVPILVLAAHGASSQDEERRPQRVSPSPTAGEAQPADRRIERTNPQPAVREAQPANRRMERADPQPAVEKAQPADRRPQRVNPPPGLSGVAFKAEDDAPYSIAPGALQKLKAGRQTMRNMAQPMFDLPYFGDDLDPGERYYVGKKIHSASGTQKWGYDIGAMRKKSGSDQWSEVKDGTDWSKIKNSDYYVWGKPVYAMAEGTVIRCWRNAPQNPRPYSSALGDDFDEPFEDRDWLHEKWRAKMMSGAGNHLLVLQDNGNLILYAHAQTGTIPQNLCPHNQALYSKAGADEEGDVPAAQQARIQPGQKLYLTGNSGNSSAPHLHVHQQDEDDNPVQFTFRRGLSTPVLEGKKADINKWTRFAGSRIPDGPVLFWPPEKLVGENSRHGYAADDFQRWFDHMADSGYWLEWLDGYSVGGKAYLNHVWRPAKGAWRAFFLLTPGAYQAEFTKADNEKFYPVMVDSSLVAGQVRYSVIFVKNKPGAALARHGLTYDQHMAVMDEAKGKNLSPVNISVVSTGGQERYTVLWRSESIGSWVVKSKIPEGEYQALYNTQSGENRKPSYVNAYMDNGKPTYTVVFAQVPGARKDRHGMTSQQYQAEFNSANLPTRAVSGYDGAQSNHKFIAFWRK